MNAVKQFLIYGLAGTASRLVMVFLVPLYTRTLDIDGYGQLEFLLAGYTLLTLLVGLQSESAVLREYHDAQKAERLPQLRWAALLIAACGAVFLMIVATVALGVGMVPEKYARFVPLVLTIAVLTQLLGIQLVLLRFAARPYLFGLVSFFDVLVSATTSVVLMLLLGWGIEGALVGILAGKAIGVLWAWSSTFARLPRQWPDWTLFHRMLGYSVPTLTPALLNWVQTNGSRVLLVAFLTFVDVAIASIGIRVAALFGFVVYAFRLAWEPWAFGQLDEKDRDVEAYNRALSGYIIGMSALAVLAISISPILVAIFAPAEYSSAVMMCGGFILGQLWIGIGQIGTIGIHGARKTGYLTHVFLVGAVMNVALLAGLSLVVGVTSAMIAYLASTMASAVTAIVVSNRLFDTRFSLRLLIGAAAFSIAVAGLGHWAFGQSQGVSPIAQLPQMGMMATAGLFGVAMLCWASISAAERHRGIRYFRQRWRNAVGAIRSED